jgi:hypothetical protein
MKFPRENTITPLLLRGGLHQYPMEDLVAHGDAGNCICCREFHSKKLFENKNSFLQTLATNPIDSYSLKSCISNAPIEGEFIE